MPLPPPRITVAGMRPAGARLAARAGDAWTCFADVYQQLRPVFDAALSAAGRTPSEVGVVVGIDHAEVVEPIAELAARWAQNGATELVIHDLGPDELERVLDLV